MIHPLITLVATRPELLSEHLGAYAELVRIEAGESVARLRSRALLSLALAGSVLLGLCLGGVALMLVAVLPLAQMPIPALLTVVALAPWLAAALCGLALQRQPGLSHFPLLRQQLAQDGSTLHEAGQR